MVVNFFFMERISGVCFVEYGSDVVFTEYFETTLLCYFREIDSNFQESCLCCLLCSNLCYVHLCCVGG